MRVPQLAAHLFAKIFIKMYKVRKSDAALLEVEYAENGIKTNLASRACEAISVNKILSKENRGKENLQICGNLREPYSVSFIVLEASNHKTMA